MNCSRVTESMAAVQNSNYIHGIESPWSNRASCSTKRCLIRDEIQWYMVRATLVCLCLHLVIAVHVYFMWRWPATFNNTKRPKTWKELIGKQISSTEKHSKRTMPKNLESRQKESLINSLAIMLAIRVYHHIESFTSAMWRQSHQHGFHFGSHLSTDCTFNLLVCW